MAKMSIGEDLEKIIKKRNRTLKNVNNHKTKIYHIFGGNGHILNKEMVQIMTELSPIYEELNSAFQTVDWVDLIYYERWLNE